MTMKAMSITERVPRPLVKPKEAAGVMTVGVALEAQVINESDDCDDAEEVDDVLGHDTEVVPETLPMMSMLSIDPVLSV